MGVGAEGELVEEVAFHLVADVEGGVGFFGEQVLPVLGDHTGAAVAADRAGVVDGVGVGVGGAEGDAVAGACEADGAGVVVGEGDGVFVVVRTPERETVAVRPGALTMSRRVPLAPVQPTLRTMAQGRVRWTLRFQTWT